MTNKFLGQTNKTIIHVLLLCFIYALIGQLSVLLAILPDYATTIFLSAGIAVAVFLILGQQAMAWHFFSVFISQSLD